MPAMPPVWGATLYMVTGVGTGSAEPLLSKC